MCSNIARPSDLLNGVDGEARQQDPFHRSSSAGRSTSLTSTTWTRHVGELPARPPGAAEGDPGRPDLDGRRPRLAGLTTRAIFAGHLRLAAADLDRPVDSTGASSTSSRRWPVASTLFARSVTVARSWQAAHDPIGGPRLLHPFADHLEDVRLAVGDVHDRRLGMPGRFVAGPAHGDQPAIALLVLDRRRRPLRPASRGVGRPPSSRTQADACTVPRGVPSGVKACITCKNTPRAHRRRSGRRHDLAGAA